MKRTHYTLLTKPVNFCLMLFLFFFQMFSFSQQADTLMPDDILKMSFYDLMNTEVISASKVKQQIKDVAATVQVITAQQIKERSCFTLEEALSDLPGFQFRNIVGFNSYVFMRGAPSQNNLILLLVDGIQINELNSGGFYGGGHFNLSDVDRIEVVYGPASALYGTNAISGIINIITKKVDAGKKGQVSLLGGNFNTGSAEFNVQNYNPDKDLGFYISGMYKTTEKADLHGEKGDDNWSDDMENFEHDLSLSAKVKIKNFDAGLLYQEKQSSMTTQYKSVGEKYLDNNTLWDIAFLNGFAKYTNTKHEKRTFNSTLYYRNATVQPNTIDHIEKATDSTPGNQVGYYRPNQLLGIEAQVNIKVSKQFFVTGGIVGELEQLSNGFSVSNSFSQSITPPRPTRPEILNNNLVSVYLQADLKIFDQLSFIGGLRQDFSNYYGQVFTPRTGLVFNENNITAKLLYNSAFRAPKPWDYKYGTGNDNLKPEKMQSLELSFSYSIQKNLNLGASVYKNLIKDKLTKETDSIVDRWINKDKLNTLGFEVYCNYSISDFVVYANYTYADSYDQDDVFIPEISVHTANAGITYSLDSHLKINLRTNYLGQRKNPSIIPNTGENVIDDALLLHTCISYFDFKKFDFQLKINNLLNQEYYHPSNRFAGRYRQPQRFITFRVSYNF